MALQTPFYTKISGIGSYLPEKRLTNHDLEKMVDTNNEWIMERTGIYARHIAAPGEYTSDLCVQAAKRAMEMAKIEPKDLDAIIVATESPDQPMPNTACIVQHKLGARQVMSLDISAACSGFVYALSLADSLIRMGTYKHILVCGGEVLHHYVNYKDRETCILFGDAAGAVIASRTEAGDPNHIFSHHLHADGSIGDLFVLPAGGSKIPFSPEVIERGDHWVRMKGREIFKHAVRTMSESIGEALEFNKMTADQIDWVVPHQANIRIVEAVVKHFGAPMSKCVIEIEDMGNTSAATIPVAMDKAVRDGRIKRGQIVCLTAFGAGITSGSLLMRY